MATNTKAVNEAKIKGRRAIRAREQKEVAFSLAELSTKGIDNHPYL